MIFVLKIVYFETHFNKSNTSKQITSLVENMLVGTFVMFHRNICFQTYGKIFRHCSDSAKHKKTKRTTLITYLSGAQRDSMQITDLL